MSDANSRYVQTLLDELGSTESKIANLEYHCTGTDHQEVKAVRSLVNDAGFKLRDLADRFHEKEVGSG